MNPMRRGSRTVGRAVVVLSAVLVLAVVGCSEEQRQDLGEEDVRVTLQSKVEDAVEKENLAINGDLACRSDLDAEPKVTASCEGSTESGEAISGTFDGTATSKTNPVRRR